MSLTHSVQRHICVLFLASALIASIVVYKRKHEENADHNNSKVYKDHHPTNQKFYSNQRTISDSNEVLHILGLFELSTKWGERVEGLSEIAAAQLAIKHVNDFDVLPDYTLKLLVNDTKVGNV